MSQMRHSFRTALPSLILLLSIAGCSSPPPPPSFPDIRFSNESQIRLNVASITVDDKFQPTFQLPWIEYQFPVPPERAVENWVRDRLVADDTNSGAAARVTILDASVQQVALAPTTTGIENAFTKEQAYRYDAHLVVKIDIIDAKGLIVRSATAQASLSRSVAEGITLNDRDTVWYQLSRDITETLGRSLETQINTSFPPYAQF